MDCTKQETNHERAADDPREPAGDHRRSARDRPLGPESANGPGYADEFSGAYGRLVARTGVAARDHAAAFCAPAKADDPMGDQLAAPREHDDVAHAQALPVRRLHQDRLSRPQRRDHAGSANVQPEP